MLWASLAGATINDLSEYTFTLKSYGGNQDLNIDFIPFFASDAIDKVRYVPNVGVPSGLSLSIAGLFGFSYVTEINEDEVTSDKGKTEYDDYRFTFAYEQFLVDLNYLDYQGFYIENTTAVDPSETAPFIKRGDISFKSYSAQFNWVFDHKKYSFMALLDQTARQEKSGGSWMAGVHISRTEISGTSALIPSSVQAEFGSDANLTEGTFLTGTASIGYGYTFVWSKYFYFGLSGLAGWGVQKRELAFASGATNSESSSNINKLDIRLGLGYHGERFFTGILAKSDSIRFLTDTVRIQYDIIGGQFFIGMHF